MTQQPFRLDPLAGPEAYKSYQILAPLSSHFRPASCEEVDCPNWRNGWKLRTDILDERMIHTATTSGRRFRWLHVSEMENWLVFEAGQPCFQASAHRTRVERPELFLVRGGDHRGNPRATPVQQHATAADWQDDFANHQDRLATEAERG